MEMWIVAAGCPIGGYSVYGLFKTVEDARAAGKRIGIMHGGDGSKVGVFPVRRPYDDEIPEGGDIVVFDGELCDQWVFYGPFYNDTDAFDWIDERTGPGYAGVIKLRPPFTEEHARKPKPPSQKTGAA